MDTNPRVEPLPRFERYRDNPEEPWHRSPRARLFGLVAGLTLVVGVIWTLLQPVVYRSSATVLMSAPSAIDAEVAAADIQSVAIQRKILLGEDITRRLAAELDATGAAGLDATELRHLLRVDPVPDTNLVEMSAQGADGELLPRLVDTWIDVYLAVRAEDIEQRKAQTMQVVQDELDGLAVKLEQARAALDDYREEHEIISVERQENEVLARLDGLNKALNNAIEEEAKTRAYLDTLREAITRGAQVVPQGDRRDVEAMDTELRELQVQMLEMSKRYTPEYIEKQPQLRAIPERIEELKAKLAQALSQGRAAELANATQAHAAAQQTVADLQRKLDEHKQRRGPVQYHLCHPPGPGGGPGRPGAVEPGHPGPAGAGGGAPGGEISPGLGHRTPGTRERAHRAGLPVVTGRYPRRRPGPGHIQRLAARGSSARNGTSRPMSPCPVCTCTRRR